MYKLLPYKLLPLVLPLLSARPGLAQMCMQPPTTIAINHDFYRAYQKLATTTQSNQFGLNVAVPIEGIPLAFGMTDDDRESKAELTTLTTNDATQIVQKELADQKVAIIAWCGYEMCQQGGNEMAIQALTGVCSLANGDGLREDNQYSVRPISGQVIFDTNETRSATLWLRLPSSPGVHGTGAASISFKSDGVTIDFPAGSTQDDIKLSSDSPTILKATFQRPAALSDAYIEFALVGSELPTQRAHFYLVPSSELLLPDASIACGKIIPGLYVLATNHNSGARDNNYETTELQLVADQPLSWTKGDSFGNGEGGADATLSATCSQGQSDKKRANTTLELEGNIHAATGNGFAGTGFHPGGGSGIYPSWKSELILPGLSGQAWDLNVSLENRLLQQAPTDGVGCSLTIDALGLSVIAAATQNKATRFESIDPGKYKVSLTCTGQPRGYPWHRSQVIQLWSGQASEISKDVSVKLRIDARRH